MLRPTLRGLTATPATFSQLGKTFPPAARNGVGRANKMRSKPSDNTAWYDRGPVEWLPRPVRLTYGQLDELRNWMMRETLHPNHESAPATGSHHAHSATTATTSAAFQEIRRLQEEYGQLPLLPVLGEVEAKFPLNLYKQNHRAKRRFLIRWHKANTPQQWLWMPRGRQGGSASPASSSPLEGNNNNNSAGGGQQQQAQLSMSLKESTIHRGANHVQSYPESWRAMMAAQRQQRQQQQLMGGGGGRRYSESQPR